MMPRRSELAKFVQRVCKDGFTAAAAANSSQSPSSSSSSSSALPHKGGLTAVLGNEGGDIDSVVCAIYTSYLMDFQYNSNTTHNNERSCGSGSSGGGSSGSGGKEASNTTTTPPPRQFIPVLNFSEEDLPLRGDVLHALAVEGLSAGDLVYTMPSSSTSVTLGSTTHSAAGVLPLDGSPSSSSSSTSLVDSIFLVDHNKLKASQGHWGPLVCSVVDHHEDEKMYLTTTTTTAAASGGDISPSPTAVFGTSPIRDIVFPCGSCASLVALRFQELKITVPSPGLLLAPILLDTMNLDPKTLKVTPNDEKAVQFLLDERRKEEAAAAGGGGKKADDVAEAGGGTSSTHIGLTSADEKEYLANWYKVLAAKKADVKSLTVAQSLRRDFKAFRFETPNTSSGGNGGGGGCVSLGLSAVVEGMADFITRITGGLEEVTMGILSHNGMLQKQCDIGGIMFCAPDPSPEAQGSIKRELLLVAIADTSAAALALDFIQSQAKEGGGPCRLNNVQTHHIEHGGPGGEEEEGTTPPAPATRIVVYECDQQNPAISRKTFVPEFKRFVDGLL